MIPIFLSMNPRTSAFLAVFSWMIAAGTVIAADNTSVPKLRDALLLGASFDKQLDADFAVGDPKLYHAPTGNRTQFKTGLPESNLVVHATGEGRYGDALRFTQKMKPSVFFHGEKNLGYTTNRWSGAVSLWLRLDPDKDLQPGYCDPLQFVAQTWTEGNMFIEFSKDHTPRHFRYAILPIRTVWNPNNRGWEDIPDKERPMVPVYKTPFSREGWTHVVFCFGNINSSKSDGWGRLYLDGKDQGAFENRLMPFNWEVGKSALTMGLNYVGWMDDVAVFNRPLTAEEVRVLHTLPGGLKSLLKKP